MIGSTISWGPRMVGSREVAKRLGIAHCTALQNLKRGVIPGAVQLGTLWQVPEESLAQIVGQSEPLIKSRERGKRKVG